MDSYSILGLQKGVSFKIIKQKYHSMAKIYHPDKTKKECEEFKKITMAYNTLKKESKSTKVSPNLVMRVLKIYREELKNVNIKKNISKCITVGSTITTLVLSFTSANLGTINIAIPFAVLSVMASLNTYRLYRRFKIIEYDIRDLEKRRIIAK